MNKSIVIHNDNINLHHFDVERMIKFYLVDKDLDEYISTEIIPKLQKLDFDVIFIKDKLSSNYLDLYGLRVAYHIRFSEKIKYFPIIILSDITSDMLARLEDSANILFTKNIFVIPNTKQEIEKKEGKIFKKLTPKQYDINFLSKIQIEQPKDYLTHHSIANEWSIYQWAEFLKVDSIQIRENKDLISSLLYFKYLSEKNPIPKAKGITFAPQSEGKILYIDDQWDKGWEDILAKIFNGCKNTNFQTFKYDFKDKSNFNLIFQVNHKGLKQQIENADVVVLDLRLIEQDHNENVEIDDYSGIKILEKIHEINAGIQVIMLTATSKSSILEKLYEKKILGYIKKEHPEDRSISTAENVNKFIQLIDKGLQRKYLKKIYATKSEIISILNIDLRIDIKDQDCEIFTKFNMPKKSYMEFVRKIYREARYTFEVLDSTLENRFIYAMLSIVSSFEAINSIFIKEYRYDNDKFWDNTIVQSSKLNDKLEELYQKLNGRDILDIEAMIKKRNNYLHSNINPITIESNEILELYEAELRMIQTIRHYNI